MSRLAASGYRRHLIGATLFAIVAIVALIAGSAYGAAAVLLVGLFVIGVWALVSAADRQYGHIRDASHEQKAAWREAAEGKVVRLDIPWRSGPGGG